MAHLRRDAVLRPLIDELPFPEQRPQLSEIYPALLRSIVGQQVSTAAAASIYRRFLELFDCDPQDPYACPRPEQVTAADQDDLRGAGLSRAKANYVRAVATYFAERPHAEQHLRALDDEAAVAELTAIKGVGRWTAEMMLLFALGRPDVLPLDDLAVRQSILQRYALDPDQRPAALRKQMMQLAEAWRPYRSYACLYLYAWRNAQKKPLR